MELNELERSQKLLDLYGQRKVQRALDELKPYLKMLQQDSLDFDGINLEWNTDGTLSTMRVEREGEMVELVFIWDGKQQLSQIVKR